MAKPGSRQKLPNFGKCIAGLALALKIKATIVLTNEIKEDIPP